MSELEVIVMAGAVVALSCLLGVIIGGRDGKAMAGMGVVYAIIFLTSVVIHRLLVTN